MTLNVISNGQIVMGRRKASNHGIRSAQADQELAERFGQLRDAAMAWADGGSIYDVEIALDLLEFDPETYNYPPLSQNMKREERIAVLAARFVNAAQFSRRLDDVVSLAHCTRDTLRDELVGAMSEPASVPAYAEKFFRRLQAEGIRQEDLHPSSRALARTVADAIRAHNLQRRSGQVEEIGEGYDDEPVASWRDLPATFSGFQLIEVEDSFFTPLPLPPFTDIAPIRPSRQKGEI